MTEDVPDGLERRAQLDLATRMAVPEGVAAARAAVG